MLSASGLAKSYRSRQVVRDFGMEVRPGEVVGLLGPNGAGKTTTLRIAAALIEPDAGRVRVDGIDALYKRCINRGVVHPQGQLEQKAWGQREFVMLDPDGVALTFFEPHQP